MLVESKDLSSSLWPDAVNDGSGGVENETLSGGKQEEVEHGEWDVVDPHFWSIDLADGVWCAWCTNLSNGHGTDPVGAHVGWAHGDKCNPPVTLLKGHVSHVKVGDGRDPWDGVDDGHVPLQEHESVCINVILESLDHWPNNAPENDHDRCVDGE